MIDINELRRLAQAATPGPWKVAYTDQNGQAVIKGEHIEIATCWHHCVGAIEKEMHANAALIVAASPAAISELLDRLEAAEKEIALKERVIDALGSELNAVAKERDALRAKIEEMEKQEPVAWLHETRRDSDVVTDAVKHVWGKAVVGAMAAYSIPLYILPGAKGE